MGRRASEPSPWERTCPGFRRSMVEAIVTGQMPDWVAGHLDGCVACRRGLAHVVARATPLSEAGRGLAEQIAFVAKVRGLAREIASLCGAQPPRPSQQTPTLRERLERDWRLPAGIALVVAVASAGLAAWLIATGPIGAPGPPPEPVPRAATPAAAAERSFRPLP